MTFRVPPLPTRKIVLEARLKCVRRAEKRLVSAGRMSQMQFWDVPECPRETAVAKRIAKYMRAGQWERYALALQCLRLARSKIAAELEGLLW